MIHSIKKFSFLIALLIGLSNNYALSMFSRLRPASSAVGRAAISRSMIKALLPNQNIIRMPGAISAVSMPQIQALPEDSSEKQSKTQMEPIVVAQEPVQSKSTEQVVAKINDAPKSSSARAARAEASRKPAQTTQPKVQKPQAQKPNAPAAKTRTESVHATVRRLMQQSKQARQAQQAAVVQKAKVQPIIEPLSVMPAIEEKTNIEVSQGDSMQLTRERAAYKQAMKVLSPVLKAINVLARIKQDAPGYVPAHADLRDALLQANASGYSVGLVEKQLVDQVGGLPEASVPLLQNQADGSAMMIPIQALGIVGMAQSASNLANVFGLQGEFAPFIYKNNNALGLSQAPQASFEIIRASMNQNNPLHFDRSKIIISPFEAQLKPLVDDADMRIAEQPNASNADNGGVGNGNNGNNNNGAPQVNAERTKFNGQPATGKAHAHSGNNGQPQSSVGNIARGLGGASGLDEIAQPDLKIVADSEIEPNVSMEKVQEIPEAMPHAVPTIRDSMRLGEHLSAEEWAINQYGNLILQALIARTDLLMEWAGNSQALQRMFEDYNTLLQQYRTIKDQFVDRLYTDANMRIYQVVSTVLDCLAGKK